MMSQLSLFAPVTLSQREPRQEKPVIPTVEASYPVVEAWPPADWLDASETAAEIGWQGPAFITTGLQDAIRRNDEFLWEILWTARYHLVELGDNPAQFTLSMGSRDYRFVASISEYSGILLRLEA